ncbi:MAG: DUF445 domain-containing protein [Candidatus Nanopelagicales bacterium]
MNAPTTDTAAPEPTGSDATAPDRASSSGMSLSPADQERQRALRRMKAVPLALLLLAAASFVLAWTMQQRSDAAVWGFVRAASEAGMVGGLADWFAVTALFRRPLGLPIPHTNLIATKKDQIGDSLGDFIQTNFLTESTVRAKVASSQPAVRIGRYLQDDAHRDFVICELSEAAEAGIESLNDEDIALLIRNMVFRQAGAITWAPPAGALLDAVMEDRAHVPAIDAFLRVVRDWVRDHGDLITAIVAERGPAQGIALARSVHEAVGRKAHTELLRWAEDAYSDPNSRTRVAIDSWLASLAQELREDPTMIERVEQLKQRLLDSGEVHRVVASLWPATKRLLLEALRDPASDLRRRADAIVADIADRLVEDPDLRGRVDARIERGAVYLTERYGTEFATIISDTVARWDASEASRRIELQVGRDLQFIRINGTVVGSLAGLVIYTFAVVVLG